MIEQEETAAEGAMKTAAEGAKTTLAEGVAKPAALSREEKLAKLARLVRQRERAAQTFPLSFLQQRLWFLDRLNPGDYAYNVFRAITWKGPFDETAFRRAVTEVVARHDALRTHFPVVAGEARQVVAAPSPNAEVEIPVDDLSSFPVVDREERAPALARIEARKPFDLATGPIFRFRFVKLAAEEHLILFSIHHIATDGWSLGIFFGELFTLYQAYGRGEGSPLPEPKLQYPDFAVWQRDRLSDEFLASELLWWREKVEGFPEILELPLDHPRPAIAKLRGAIESFVVPENLSNDLAAAARKHSATPFMVLLAAFEAVLARSCDQDLFLIGTNVHGRHRAELETVVGFFAETLVLRAKVARDRPFSELLAWVKRDTLDAQAHQELPFEVLVEDRQSERQLAHNPLVQVLFILQNLPGDPARIPNVELGSLNVERGFARLDITLEMTLGPNGFVGYFEYNTDIFERPTMARLAERFVRFLEGAVGDLLANSNDANANRPVGRIPWMSAAERRRALVDWNPRFSGSPALVPTAIAERARSMPDAPAVLFGDHTLSYSELIASANRWARALRRRGVGLDTPVGVCLERSVEMPAALLAVLVSGGAWVPLDPAYPIERIAAIVDETRMPVVISTSDLEDRLPAGTPSAFLDRGFGDDEDAGPPDWELHPEALAYVIYTSGSTGRPKGVGVPHKSLANHAAACAERYALTSEDRALQFTSISFDITSEEIFPTWLAGGAVVPRAPGLFPSFGELHELIVRHGITVANLPTAYWHEWVGELVRSGEKPPAPLRLVVVGTEQALPERVADWLTVAQREDGAVRWINGYASTEATVTALTFEPTAAQAPALRRALKVPVGTPITNCRAYVLDAEFEPVPVGIHGDVYIGGPNVSRGYLDWPDRTAASFVPDPFAEELGYGPGQRLYYQGDRGRYLADGTIECLGRSDFQVKIRGFRIEPGEIEATLARHPAVLECIVLVAEEAPGVRRLVGYVGLEPAQKTTSEDLRNHLRQTLPEHMVPAAIVVLDSLPLNANGKIDRRALAKIEAEVEVKNETSRPASSPIEELVADIWKDLLRITVVGRTENFFDLGGHSLLATQVVTRLREALGVEVPLRTIFDAPTIAGLATEVERRRRGNEAAPPPIERVPRDQPLVCSFSQQRLWFLDRLLPGDPANNLPVAIRFEGEMDEAVLRRAVAELVRRHEALRTTFAASATGEPIQVVAPAGGTLPMPIVDYSRFDLAYTRETEAIARLGDFSRRPLDLARGPIVQWLLVRLAPQDFLLYYTIHHIVCDGASITRIAEEVVAIYEAYLRGEKSPLPEPRLQYADFAAWQRSWLAGDELTRQIEYWRERLAGAPTVIELPTDRPRPAVATSRGSRLNVRLDGRLMERLSDLARRRGSTLFMACQAIWNTLLSRLSGQDDVVVGWPIAGRSRAELEGVVGFLANILVLRTHLGGSPDFVQLLARVRESVLGAFDHQEMPFEQLVEELRPERHLSHNPIFQVFFVLHHAQAQGGASAGDDGPVLPGVKISQPPIDNHTVRGDLLLALTQYRNSLTGALEYNTDLFDEATIARWSASFERLARAVCDDPSVAIDALPLISQEERQQLVVGWNHTACDYREDATVFDLFREQAERTPNGLALAFDVDGERLTYAELGARAHALALRLRAEGVRPGTLVGVFLERSPALLVTLLAVHEAGGAYVPLDPAYPADRVAYVLEDSGATVVVTQPELRFELPSVEATVIEIEANGVSDESADGDLSQIAAAPEDLAYVIYTSGSTGRPKGVAVRHRNVVNFLTSMAATPGLAANDALFAVTTISFDIAGLELFLPLSVGGTVILSRRDTATDGRLLAAALVETQATALQATPATWRLLLASGWLGAPNLKALCGGEALPVDLAAELLPKVASLWNVYGPTETTIWSSVERVTPESLREGPSISLGRPIANTQIHLLDRRFEPVPIGVAGELWIGGDGVAAGYLGRPDLTSERFVPDPFVSDAERGSARLYRTGDLARRLVDGRIVYLGRTDFQVKVRGYRIELGEIEAVLSRHPAIAQSAVALCDVQGDKQLAAYYVVKPGAATVNVGSLRAALREELPDYMIPSFFVALPALPLTPNGKVDRKALPAPEGGRTERVREYVAPHGEVEEKLAGIWREVLGSERIDRVGALDNFFELGGHSLMATQVLARVQRDFGIELPLRTMFDHPTLRGLAEVLVAREIESADAALLAQLLQEMSASQ